MAGRYYLVVEGHGEVEAARNLVTRLSADIGLALGPWAPPMRAKNLSTPDSVAQVCALLRSKADAAGALLLRDDEDGCPRIDGPRLAASVRAAALPFPVGITLFFREYESLFLASAESLAGRSLGTGGTERPGVRAGTIAPANVEAIRGAKEWLTRHYPTGRAYKPTLDQLDLTRQLDFGVLRASGLPCFGTLERTLRFLSAAAPGAVYP